MKVLIVGQYPRRATSEPWEKPFDLGPAVHRLEQLLRLPEGTFRHNPNVDFVNLLEGVMGGSEARTAMEVAAEIDTSKYGLVILCGAAVRHAFGFPGVQILELARRGETRFLILPLPTDKARFWESRSNRRNAAGIVRSLLEQDT